MARPRYKRTASQHAAPEATPENTVPEVPVVLPHVVMRVGDDGTMTVTVDGTDYPPEDPGRPWRRESFPVILDALTTTRRSPVRVEVHESDASTFTDIITSRPVPATRPVPAESEAESPSPAHRVEVTGEGFTAGEDVAVAIIVDHAPASESGTLRHLLDTTHLDDAASDDTGGGVVLFGRVSGTVVIVGGRP